MDKFISGVVILSLQLVLNSLVKSIMNILGINNSYINIITSTIICIASFYLGNKCIQDKELGKQRTSLFISEIIIFQSIILFIMIIG